MAEPSGWFDPQLLIEAWFDDDLAPTSRGWFDEDLIQAAAGAPPSTINARPVRNLMGVGF